MTDLEKECQLRLAAMTGAERVAQSLARWQWAWEMIARQIPITLRATLCPLCLCVLIARIRARERSSPDLKNGFFLRARAKQEPYTHVIVQGRSLTPT